MTLLPVAVIAKTAAAAAASAASEVLPTSAMLQQLVVRACSEIARRCCASASRRGSYASSLGCRCQVCVRAAVLALKQISIPSRRSSLAELQRTKHLDPYLGSTDTQHALLKQPW
jgi:hypothetical protein